MDGRKQKYHEDCNTFTIRGPAGSFNAALEELGKLQLIKVTYKNKAPTTFEIWVDTEFNKQRLEEILSGLETKIYKA